MAFSWNLSSNSGMSAQGGTGELQAHRSTAPTGEISALRAAQSGTGFENPPPLAISSNLLKFLKCMDLKLVGLGLGCVPFHSGWELVEWVPKSVDLGEN